MSQIETQARIAIAGTIEYRDKDGNLIKAVPFTGAVPLEQMEHKEEQEQPNGDLRE